MYHREGTESTEERIERVVTIDRLLVSACVPYKKILVV